MHSCLDNKDNRAASPGSEKFLKSQGDAFVFLVFREDRSIMQVGSL